MAYVYQHIRLDKNEVFYVGIGDEDNFKRAYKKSQRNAYWQNITSITEYKVEIIEDRLTWDEACQREAYYIKLYGRKDKKTGSLCNLTDGGEGAKGVLRGVITRKKLSEANKGKHHSEETKEKLKINSSGNKNALGYKHTNEAKAKMKGRQRSDEHREKLSLSCKGRCISELNMQKLLEANYKKVYDTKAGVLYDSLKDAAKAFNLKTSLLSRYLNGVRTNKTPLKFL